LPAEDVPDDVALSLRVDRAGPLTLQRQLLDQLRHAILAGHLAPGRRLPATRTLAAALGVSRNVAEEVYDELAVQGYLVRRHGSGTYVGSDLPRLPLASRSSPETSPRAGRGERAAPPVPAPARESTIIFAPGSPDVTLLPASVWRAIWCGVGMQMPPDAYGPPAGDPELRAALAEYLKRARRLDCSPDDIVVTNGAMQALDLLARATLAPGDAVAFEEPGYLMARQALLAHGARIVPIPVDDDGIRVEALPRGPAAPGLVYVTPSHQYPLGARLSVGRRIALLEWAAHHDSLIIEDDYDSEFRFGAPPLPTLAELAGLDHPAPVVYVGTFSKILTPALRIGYLVTPRPELRQRVERLKSISDFHVSWPVQRALFELISRGHLERHVRRMRRRYAEKRALLDRSLASLAPIARLRGMDAGLHVYLELRDVLDPAAIVHETSRHGVRVLPLDVFYHGPPDRRGLVLGYGGLVPEEIVRGAGVLRAAIARQAGLTLGCG
jgi:GntR family transcriptional regulator/MocR family aminotransferase